MNLNDYPTPRTDELEKNWTHLQGTRFAFKSILTSHLELERESAAWRDVATRLVAAITNDSGWIEAEEAFDRLLTETQTP